MGVTYWDAWALWWAGDPELPRYLLGGLEIYWWARVGKAAGLIAAVVLVVEIIGLERLRSWAIALSSLRSRSHALGPVRRFVRIYSLDDLDSTDEQERVGCWTLAVTAAGYMLLAAILLLGYSWLGSHTVRYVPLLLLVVPAFGLLVVLSHAIPVAILFGVGTLSSVLAHRQAARLLNAIALLAVLFAFHFEMLAS